MLEFIKVSAFTAWTFIAIALAIIEICIPGIWIIWFAIPALLVGLLCLIIDFSFYAQLLIFASLSLITLIFLLKFGRKNSHSAPDTPEMNQRGQNYFSQIYVLDTAVVNGQGRIKLGDSYWILQGKDCPAGTQIKITKSHLNALCFEILD